MDLVSEMKCVENLSDFEKLFKYSFPLVIVTL